jgi:putative DNA primase/helicase
LIPFAVTIPPEKRDKTLGTRMRDEWPGILAWAVRGCLEWQEMGLCAPEEVVAATRDYREEMDMIGAWLTERCVVTAHARVQASAAYHDYTKWTDARGARPMSLMSFSRKLTDRGFEKRKSSSVFFFGLGLLAEAEGAGAVADSGAGTPVAGGDVGADAF